ncbi:MAG TPA: GNAT family N-acetyltransferase [Bacteroidia bacterium]|nr:GNAT family N-acetyltransferase [Bacteroidia bacterium]
MKIKILNSSLEKQYSDFLLQYPETLLYTSNKYRLLLKQFLKEEDIYLMAIDDKDEVKGVLPAFLKKNGGFGNVLNSIPFYGSNGGVVEFENNESVRNLLIEEFYKLAKQYNCVSTTLISSPLYPMEDFFEKTTDYTLKDSRIGQLTRLPEFSDDVDGSVMKIIHYKTRNLIRKAQKMEISFSDESGKGYLDFLIETHQENLAAIGGISKPEIFFRLIPEIFIYGSDYKIYHAKKDGKLIAALLVFYYNKTVEYYTPVIKAEFRNSQPMSLLIFEAMKNAVVAGYNWWNWGGTWASQGGVYQFKSGWGTQDKMYYYYTKIFSDSILNKTKEQLLSEYPYFFVAPFNVLKPS